MLSLEPGWARLRQSWIQSDLGLSQENLSWVFNAYVVAFGGLLPLVGSAVVGAAGLLVEMALAVCVVRTTTPR